MSEGNDIKPEVFRAFKYQRQTLGERRALQITTTTQKFDDRGKPLEVGLAPRGEREVLSRAFY